MNVSRPVAVMLVVLVLLQSSAAIAVTGPSHQATSGVTYETNSGLEVSLASDRDIPAVPFAGSNTFAPGEGVEITAAGTASASISDGTFADGQMQVLNIDASTTPVRVERDDLPSAATVRDGQAFVDRMLRSLLVWAPLFVLASGVVSAVVYYFRKERSATRRVR